mmetsp:Transcript_93541/g.175934  ORF Transcript_93541/g.175934 Transcript_93541/m.175934 type:complete len:149 (+) Transcript_93541:442-888(+)
MPWSLRLRKTDLARLLITNAMMKKISDRTKQAMEILDVRPCRFSITEWWSACNLPGCMLATIPPSIKRTPTSVSGVPMTLWISTTMTKMKGNVKIAAAELMTSGSREYGMTLFAILLPFAAPKRSEKVNGSSSPKDKKANTAPNSIFQ